MGARQRRRVEARSVDAALSGDPKRSSISKNKSPDSDKAGADPSTKRSTYRVVAGVGLLLAILALVAYELLRTDGTTPVADDARGRVKASGQDDIVNLARKAVERNVRLDKVYATLPDVDVAPFAYASEATTANFNNIINGSATGLALVVFFDPRSESFLYLREEFDRAAKLVKEDRGLGAVAQVAMVNVAVETYLQHLFSPETLLSWQEDERSDESTESKGFLFGRNNFYPIIVKLFRAGKIVDEYIDVVRASRIVHFIRLHAAPVVEVLDGLEALSLFLESRVPATVAYFPGSALPTPSSLDGINATLDEWEPCAVERLAFSIIARTSPGKFFYGHIAHQEALMTTSAPCTVLVRNEDAETTYFEKTAQNHSAAARKEYVSNLMRFMQESREPVLKELTPDNSWEIAQQFRYIAILLVDMTNPKSFARARRIATLAASHDCFKNKSLSVKFTFADGPNFAPQFGLSTEQLPNVALFNALADDRAVFHDGSDTVPHLPLLNAEDEISAEALRTWILRLVEPDERKQAALSDGGENSAEADETPRADEEASVTRALHQTTSWRNIQPAVTMKVQDEPLEQIWARFLSLYANILVYEEAYAEMGPERQNMLENQVLRKVLDRFHSHLANRPHLALLVETLPKTPGELGTFSRNKDTQERFWAKLQKLSAYKAELAVLARHSRDSGQSLKALFVDDLTVAFNTCLALLKERSQAVVERFLREHGRPPRLEDQVVRSIERRSVDDLSVREFLEEYAKKRKPVIISGLDLFNRPWTKEHIASKCGHKRPEFLRKDPLAHTWGGLVPVSESINLTEFLSTHTTNQTRAGWYLHDWSLPWHCPEIFGPPPFTEFRFPRYFSGDYFQRMPFIGYQHSWPSLFVGANNTESAMHIDSGGTNFWMYLINGTKEWRFFDRFDTIELYAEPMSSHFFVDVFRPDVQSDPLFVNAAMYQGVQRPGDLVFIPGGCPHGVRNLDDIVGISMNLLDVSNENLYLWMKLFGEDYRDYELYANPNFPRGLRSDQHDFTFGEFKSQKWYAQRGEMDLF